MTGGLVAGSKEMCSQILQNVQMVVVSDLLNFNATPEDLGNCSMGSVGNCSCAATIYHFSTYGEKEDNEEARRSQAGEETDSACWQLLPTRIRCTRCQLQPSQRSQRLTPSQLYRPPHQAPRLLPQPQPQLRFSRPKRLLRPLLPISILPLRRRLQRYRRREILRLLAIILTS